MRRAVAAGLVAVLLVTAGCVGGIGGSATQAPGSDGGATDGGSDGASADSGTVSFYISDRPNDMDDFEHLNVTVTTVQFHLVEENESDANGTETPESTETVTVTATATPDDTATPTITAVEDDANENETAEPTETPEPTESPESDDEADEDDEGDESEEEDEADEDDEGEDGRWVTREINTTTVDLTELRGANATLVEQFDLPAGEYDQVRLVVSETSGTLKDGGSTEVKLPSERLKLNQRFVVGNGQEVDFVYDITVHEAGNSGMYILRPVASESGTDVEIDPVDDEDESTLDVRFTGSVSPGENATVRVTQQGEAVASATVTVDDVTEGTTNANGEFTFQVPADAEEIEVEVTAGDAEGELEREFGESDDADDDRRGGGPDNGNGGGSDG